ncbi:TPA: hypothetical protein SL557_000336 [Pseudomonas aeruginosa]|uniref:hypothetical protein n=1 Tax=Pseudomonas aeruginosa TaxID=287 RepID=UPI0029DE0928|nr:hypothetical protein [Pseudomonas aeruginosa]
MKSKRATISISKLARYASDPESVFEKVNEGAVRYGNRAHASIGKGPSLVLFIIVAIVILIAARKVGLL